MRRTSRLIIRTYLMVVAVVAAAVVVARTASALPLERFESRLQIACGEGQRSCSGSIRDTDTLGRITGFSVVKSSAGAVQLDVAGAHKGALRLSAHGTSDLVLTLSWDGDLNPDLLSGSGLNCFDLTRQGAYAFVLSQASLRAVCGGESRFGGGCPAFSMESRVYNASDPTGQKFSASVVTRSLPDIADVVVPFSNFIRHGPRGKGSFSCAGAVTVSFTFRGFSEMDLTIGPAYSNGAEGLTPLPTPSEPPTLTPTSSPTATPSSTPTLTPTMTFEPTSTPIPTLTVAGAVETSQAAPGPELTASAAPSPSVVGAALPQALTAEGQSTRELQPTKAAAAPQAPQEAVYGELVSE